MFDKLKDVTDIFHSFLRYADIQFQTYSMWRFGNFHPIRNNSITNNEAQDR